MRVHLLAVSIVLASAGTLLPPAGPAIAAGKWAAAPPVPSPADATSSVLQDVSVGAPDDVWAVGAWWNADVHPFAVHWDGRVWAAQSLPDLARPTYLTGVDQIEPRNVWAVGSTELEPGDPTPDTAVVLHFDGTAWSVVPSPAGAASGLHDIDMRTSTDGWAVGQATSTKLPGAPLILHWQGDRWSPSPAPDIDNATLTSVAAVAADDVWAVGTQQGLAGTTAAVVLHYDGASWRRVAVPAPANATLDSVAVTSATDVWASGTTCPLTCLPVVLHLTDGAWRTETTAGGTEVTEIVPFTPDDVWALGFTRTSTGLKYVHAEHWNGEKFTADPSAVTVLPSPPQAPQGEIASATPLAGAAGDPKSGVLWAVGWAPGPARVPQVIYRG